MSDTFDPDDMPEDPDDPSIPQHVKDQADILLERWNNFADECRQMGLYVEGEPQIMMVPTPFGVEQAGLGVQFNIGKVAFSDRVLNPESDKFDKDIRTMEVTMADDNFLDERKRIADLLAEGKSMDEILLGEDDDDT